MFRLSGLLIALLIALASAAGATEETVWQIGQFDRNWAEFAIAGDYAAFPAHFGGKPIVYDVAASQPARDWPFIHPGPADGWSGGGVHPLAIRFNLPAEPKGIYTLRIALVDTQGQMPPACAIAVNGRTGSVRMPRGAGDNSLKDPAAGRPHAIELALAASLFRQGVNEITLTLTDGSWVQYDALSLTCNPDVDQAAADIRTITVRPTPFFIRDGGQVRRAVDVSVELTAPVGALSLRVEAGGSACEIPVTELPVFGSVSQEVAVPDVEGPLEVKVTATADGKTKSASATVPPQKKWRLFVAPSSHTDVGYTDLQPACVERHNENLDLAAKLLETYPDFKWNCEVAWQAENYLAMRPEADRERFLALARDGKLGVQALYCNILTGLCSPEQACRLTACAYGLHQQYGIPYRSAMINDVPTWVGSLPMLLARSGIRYFSAGSNNTRAPTFHQLYNQPLWWEGPDGSRVLVMFVPSYAYAAQLGLLGSLDQARGAVLQHIAAYEGRSDYPFDAIWCNGGVSDNCPLTPALAEVVHAWNERYEFPKVILCHNAEFFEYIEANHSGDLPVVRGSAGTYWEDGAGSSARETALNRAAHEMLGSAEKFLALTDSLPGSPAAEYPAEVFAEAWRNAMLYDEHTWGAHCSISQPESDFTTGQWKIKAQFAHDAHSQAGALLDQAQGRLALLVKTEGDALVVVNPMAWPRDDVIEVTLPAGLGVADPSVTVCASGETVLLKVKDLPPCGWRTIALGPRGKEEEKKEGRVGDPTYVEGTAIESRFYRVEFDPATGAIRSIVDKDLGQELVDPQAPYQLNQYLYVSGGKGTSIEEAGRPAAELKVAVPREPKLQSAALGKLGQRMTVRASAEMTPEVVSEVTVYEDVKRIDITNRLAKTLTYEKEAAYFAFPFAGEKPALRYEEPAMVVRTDRDMMPGACYDWFTVQHFVEIDRGDAAIAWATPDAPLVSFEDINRGKWQTSLPGATGHVYAYVMNNYWFTNYLAGQDGAFTFRFSLTSGPKADVVAAARFGWEASNRPLVIQASANPGGPLPAAGSLLEIAEPGVMLIGVKQANAGRGLVLRLWEMTGQPTIAHVKLTHRTVAKATACNLVEEAEQPLEIRDGTIAVPVPASGVATVVVE